MLVWWFTQLPDEIQADCPLPSDETGEEKFMSWRHRPRPLKAQLETYLRQVVNHPRLEPFRCLGLCDFLEMVRPCSVSLVRLGRYLTLHVAPLMQEYVHDTCPGSYRSASRAQVA